MSGGDQRPQVTGPEKERGRAASTGKGGAEASKPGAPVDALVAFGDALAGAGKSTKRGGGDPQVSTAFALGWQMAELYRPERRRKAKGGDGLPGLGSLGDGDRIEILAKQVQVQLRLLRDPIEKAGLPAVDVDRLQGSLVQDEQARSKAIHALHRSLLGTLTAADFRLGKAYGLGQALADACRRPTDWSGIRKELGTQGIADLIGWLDELSTAFPPHAAHSVGTSLGEWVEWAADPEHDEWEESPSALRRQGELWRALLSDEKRGPEMLETKNYLDAAHGLAGTMRSILKGVIRHFPGLVALTGLLFAGGVALLVVGGGSEDVAGAATILAALGLSWKGLGGALGRLAGRLEQPLYDALIDRAIADAITLLPSNQADHRERQALALRLSAPGVHAGAKTDEASGGATPRPPSGALPAP